MFYKQISQLHHLMVNLFGEIPAKGELDVTCFTFMNISYIALRF